MSSEMVPRRAVCEGPKLREHMPSVSRPSFGIQARCTLATSS
jgi:hypothetical protein